jgi:hypothetical protein
MHEEGAAKHLVFEPASACAALWHSICVPSMAYGVMYEEGAVVPLMFPFVSTPYAHAVRLKG